MVTFSVSVNINSAVVSDKENSCIQVNAGFWFLFKKKMAPNKDATSNTNQPIKTNYV